MKGTTATILIMALFAVSFCQDTPAATTTTYVCAEGCTCTKTGGCNGCEPNYTFTEIKPTVTTTPTRLMETTTEEKYGKCTMNETKSLLWFLLIGLVLGPILIVLIWAVFCPKGFSNFQNSQCGSSHPNPEAHKINA